MDRTVALRDLILDDQRKIQRVDSEQIFHPLAQADDRVTEITLEKSESEYSISVLYTCRFYVYFHSCLHLWHLLSCYHASKMKKYRS